MENFHKTASVVHCTALKRQEFSPPALPLDFKRFQLLSEETVHLNEKLNYSYGGVLK